MRFNTISLAVTNRVATIAIDRPHRLNALTAETITELGTALDGALASGARAIVLTGTGRAFCSGADLRDESEPVSQDIGEMLRSAYNPLVAKIADMDVPILTAVNGLAAGAGVGLALLGDIVIMARSSYLLLAFVNIGLVPDFGAIWSIAHSAGRAKALELALLGERLAAGEALALGLITRVVDDGTCLAETQALAGRLADGPSIAIGLIRRQVPAALSSTLIEALSVESCNQSIAGSTADYREAIAAFGEKRKPSFIGH